MANQYVLLCEETARGTKPGAPTWLALPITGRLRPIYTPTDEARQEFRGQNTRLGPLTSIRRSAVWAYSLECLWYPDSPAIGLLFKHLLGIAGTRTVLETTAYKGILYPDEKPYGSEGAEPLADKAIGLSVNTDEAGTTKSQYFGGGRVGQCVIEIGGTDDVKLTFAMFGNGEWVGDVDQTLVAEQTYPSASPFVASDVTFYAGTGISRTGTGPGYTDIAPGTMAVGIPDSLTITIANALADEAKLNGIKGPSVTTAGGPVAVTVEGVADNLDPASGFSFSDEWKRIFDGVTTTNLLMVLDNGELAGDTSENFAATIDLPVGRLSTEGPEDNPDGTTAKVNLSYASQNSDTTKYPVAIMTVDQNSAY